VVEGQEFLRAARARSFEALFNAIADALQTVTEQDAQGWFLYLAMLQDNRELL